MVKRSLSLIVIEPTWQHCFGFLCRRFISVANPQRLNYSSLKLDPTQDTTHLTQRPCYQLGSPCQDPAGNWTTRRRPDHRKEMQTAVVWSCFPFIRSVQNHLARHSERGKKTRQTEEEVGRQHQGMDTPCSPSP